MPLRSLGNKYSFVGDRISRLIQVKPMYIACSYGFIRLSRFPCQIVGILFFVEQNLKQVWIDRGSTAFCLIGWNPEILTWNGTIERSSKVIALIRLLVLSPHDTVLHIQFYTVSTIATPNKCFEVEIENDELHFDSRDGICKKPLRSYEKKNGNWFK
jgi:hypothetical protein